MRNNGRCVWPETEEWWYIWFCGMLKETRGCLNRYYHYRNSYPTMETHIPEKTVFILNRGPVRTRVAVHNSACIHQVAWWRHQMETFSALLAICAGNSPVPGEFPAQRPVTRSFDVFFDLRLIKRLSKQSSGWWFETLSCPLWRHCNGKYVYRQIPWSLEAAKLDVIVIVSLWNLTGISAALERLKKSEPEFRGFETSWDLEVRRLAARWPRLSCTGWPWKHRMLQRLRTKNRQPISREPWHVFCEFFVEKYCDIHKECIVQDCSVIRIDTDGKSRLVTDIVLPKEYAFTQVLLFISVKPIQ